MAACAARAEASDGERPKGYVPPPGKRCLLHTGGQAGGRAFKGLLKAATALPAAWDSRDRGWIGAVKNQGSVNSCWAFAAYETLEAQMRKLGRGESDFSEKNMVNLHGFDSVGWNDGGNEILSSAYLLRWGGAVAETNDTYISLSSKWRTDSAPMNPAVHVQNEIWVPPRESSADNDTLKEAIMEYGAVAVAMYHRSLYESEKGGAYFYDGTNRSNHAVAVVGWDDEYPVENFRSSKRPQNPGAWLVKNSWGTGNGDGGYLHVSYEDAIFARDDIGFVYIPAARDEDYSAVYGYDRLGPCSSIDTYGKWQIAAVFQSAWNEELAAIGLYSSAEKLEYSIEIYTNVTLGASDPTENGSLARMQPGGVLEKPGYSTIHLDSPLPLAAGETFAVVFSSGTSAPYFCMSVPWDGIWDFAPTPGRTFCKTKFRNWTDTAQTYHGNICLKAYMRSTRAAQPGDSPPETESGARMLDEIAAEDGALFAQGAGSFGALANIVGDNGRSLWASWMTGLDPTDQDDGKFTLDLTFIDGKPHLNWSPDLGSERKYTKWGKASLTDESWTVVDSLQDTDARFFKVTIGQ